MTGSTAKRGYGHAHQKIRAQWAPLVRQGGVCCHRCGWPIHPTSEPGEGWDMGHNEDRTAYTGPEHAACNRSAGATLGNRMRGNWRAARW